jgi:hypothetical protein
MLRHTYDFSDLLPSCLCSVKLSVSSLVPTSTLFKHLRWKSLPDTAYTLEQGTRWIRVNDEFL